MVIPKDQDAILNRWREYFSKFLIPAGAAPSQTQKEHVEEDIQINKADVNAGIKSLRTGKTPCENDIRFKMLKARNRYGFCWLIRVCQVIWKIDQARRQANLQYKQVDKRNSTNHSGSIITVLGKVYAKCLEQGR